jgi:hypothetical protein
MVHPTHTGLHTANEELQFLPETPANFTNIVKPAESRSASYQMGGDKVRWTQR